MTYEITADSIPQPGTWQDATIRKMAVLQVDFEANRKYLKEKLYGGIKIRKEWKSNDNLVAFTFVGIMCLYVG